MYEVTMPKLSDSMEVGKIIEWRVAEGDELHEGDVLAEVESDKAAMELECYHDGVMARIVHGNGSEVSVGEVIALITAQGELLDEAPASAEPKASTPEPAPAEPKPKKAPAPATAPVGDGVAISPYARKLAREKGIGLAALTGTGPGGRIIARDVQGAPEGEAAPAPPKPQPAAAAAEPRARVIAEKLEVDLSAVNGTGIGGRITVEDVLAAHETKPHVLAPSPDEELPPLDVSADEAEIEDAPFRIKTQARRVTASKHVIPHFYMTRGAEVSELLAMKGALKEAGVSVTHAVMAACIAAIRKHPEINRTYDHGRIIKWKGIHVGLAVAAEDGLTVAVLKNAQDMALEQLAAETNALVDRARKGKLTSDERNHATFTISNLGMFDVEHFAPIINPPSAITLGVASALDVPVVKDGVVAPGKVMRLTLACDHRIVDGVEAAEFLQTLKHLLEHPTEIPGA